MKRRRVLAAVGSAALSATAGCLNDPGIEGGLLEVFEADAPPNATVTDAADEGIRDLAPVQDGLRQAHEGEGVAEIEVPASGYDEVADALAALPWYERTEHDSNHVSGIYIRYEGSVYVLVLTPFCTDSWFRDAQSQRGEYGWGGCFDRDRWERENK